jgi:hypothetical protein
MPDYSPIVKQKLRCEHIITCMVKKGFAMQHMASYTSPA